MKQFVAILFIGFAVPAISQEKINFALPAASPAASFTQQLGTADVSVSYSRPMARGRKVFGALVLYDSLWRTGASDCTTIEFSQPMIMAGKTLSGGKYSLFTIPAENEWTIIINSDTALHGSFGYDSKKDITRFKVPVVKTDKRFEAFTISLEDISIKGGGNLALSWENIMVKIPISSPADEKIMATINERLITGKESNAELLFQAANYFYGTGRDLNQAALWLNSAEKADPDNFNYPNLRQKVLGDLKDYKNGLEAAKKALVLAEKKKITNSLPALKKRIAEWEMLLKN